MRTDRPIDIQVGPLHAAGALQAPAEVDHHVGLLHLNVEAGLSGLN